MDRTAHFEPGYLNQASAQSGFVNLCLRNDTRYGLSRPIWVCQWVSQAMLPTMGCGNQDERWPRMDTMAHNGFWNGL